MNTYTPQVHGWIDQLRDLPVGTSVAAFFLVPQAGYPIPVVAQRPVQSDVDLIITIPDGFIDFRTIPTYHRTPSGLETSVLVETTQLQSEKIERDSIPQLLRDMSGLPIEALASLCHVSRNAYYKWLDGKGVNDEHAEHLIELLGVFRTIHDLRGSNLHEFLETPGPAGKPVDLLMAGNNDAVVGLALRPSSAYVESDSVSNAAREISSLPGWIRPVVKLRWDAPRLSASELDNALDWLNPGPHFSVVDSFNNPAFPDDIVAAIIKPILENLSQMQMNNDLDFEALDNVKEIRLAKIVGPPPFDVRLLFIVPESGLPDKGLSLARLISRMRGWFNPNAARLVAWDTPNLYKISVGDYLSTQQIYLEQYTYRGQIIQGLLPTSNI